MTDTGLRGFFLGNRHRIRVSILLLSMFLQLGVFILGSTVSLTSDEVSKILESFPSPPVTWDVLALHNMRVSMPGFFPLFGAWWTEYKGLKTGVALKTIAMKGRESATSLLSEMAHARSFHNLRLIT